MVNTAAIVIINNMIAILLLSVVIFLFTLWAKKKFCSRLEPPLVDGAYPLIRHCWVGLVKEKHTFNTLVKLFEPTFKRNEILVTLDFSLCKLYFCMDPEYGNTLMNTFLEKDSFYKLFSPIFGGENGLITAKVQTWKVHRKLLNPTMNQSVLDSYLPELNDHSRQLIQSMEQQLDKGPFDQLVYIKQTILRIICSTLMELNLEDEYSVIQEFGTVLDNLMTCMMKRCLTFYLHSDFIFNMSNAKKNQDFVENAFRNIFNVIIRKKKATRADQNGEVVDAHPQRFKSLIDHLLDMEESGTLTESEVHQEIATFFGAAFDTTFQTIGMILLSIGSYPVVQKKIFEELQSVFEGSKRDVQKQDLAKLKYLEATIKETMRLFPVVTVIGRTLDKDLKLEKYTLPAGSRCYVSIYHLGRHHVWGADAEQFRPERWLDGSLPQQAGAFSGFGLGKRSCIGSNFAMMLMKTILCHVVRAYWISGDITQLVRIFEAVMKPISGHHISIQKRADSDPQ